jgi:hypothetical protein
MQLARAWGGGSLYYVLLMSAPEVWFGFEKKALQVFGFFLALRIICPRARFRGAAAQQLIHKPKPTRRYV